MPYIRYHRLTTGTIAAGGSKEDTWKADAKYVLREVLVSERAAGALTNVQFYADIDGVPFCRPDVPGYILDAARPARHLGNWPFTKGSSFNYKLTSGPGGTYDIVLVLETAEWPPT